MSERFDFREWTEELSRVPITRFTNPSKRTVIAVAHALRQYVRADGTNAHPGVEALAERTGLSRPTVRRALEWLTDNRWVRRHPRAGRLADVFDLLPAEIPLANGPVDLADVEADDGELGTLVDLWNGRNATSVVGNSGGNFAGNSDPFVGNPVAHKPPVSGKPVSPKNETIEISSSSQSEEPPGAGARAGPREAANPRPPDGLLSTPDVDRWGNRRHADRFGNRLATDAEIEAAYRRRHVAGVDPDALAAVRRVRAQRGWKPGPTAALPPPASPPPADFDPWTAPPNVEWLDDRRNTNLASGAPIPTSEGADRLKTKTSESRDRPMSQPEDIGCTAPEADIPEGEPF